MKKFLYVLMAAGALLAGAVSCSESDADEDSVTGYTGKMEYANFNTTSGENKITFSYDFLTGGKVYYHLIYEWEFSRDICTSCTVTYECPSSTIAQMVYKNFNENFKNKTRVSGEKIIVDMTEDYADYSKSQIETLVAAMQEGLEEQNEYLNR